MGKVLLINDLSGVGKVALSAMIPVLSSFGHEVDTCPTALVSNTLDYGIFNIFDTTEHMEKSFEAWKKLDFEFDCITTGFLLKEKQSELIAGYLQSFKKKPLVIVDPIMGDDGHCYPGLDPKIVMIMRKMISIADIILPNFTEAALLIEKYTRQMEISEAESMDLIHRLKALGARSILVTSCISSETKTPFVLGYDAKEDRIFRCTYDLIPIRFPGTGDIFTSGLCDQLLRGETLEKSCKKTMDLVYDLIKMNQNKEDLYAGLDLESSLIRIKERMG